MNIVIDSSAIIAVIVAEPERDAIIAATSGHTLIGPGSIPWEIGNAFSAMIKQRRVGVSDAQRGLEILDSIPLQYVSVDMANALSIAAQVNVYAYDAYFLDCALRHAAPLLTLDRTLGRVAAALGVNLVSLEG
jgi:predicted nucleic acid-binding protein